MARSRIILEKGMFLGEGQLKFVREIEGKTYPSGVYERWVEVICPKCGKIVEETPSTAEELLFTRYQLGALVNTSLN